MAKKKTPSTPATLILRRHEIPYSVHPYKYEPRGGTACSSRELGVDEHLVIKTLVMEDENAAPCIVLMHGDCSVSAKELARSIGCKSISPCQPDVAQRHTGYLTGGTSPFATRKTLPLYVEVSILSLAQIYINAGRRGLLLKLAPKDLRTLLNPVPVQVATR